jgi:hypothetical protein
MGQGMNEALIRRGFASKPKRQHHMTRTAVTALGLMLVLACGPPALANMSCPDFTRAYAIQDAAALADARQIARPWIDASEESQVLVVGPAVGQQMLRLGPDTYLAQIGTDCQALPTDTVKGIVATRLRAEQRLLAKLEQSRVAGKLHQ